MKFELPRRHRRSFEVSTKKKLSDNFNKKESLEIFEIIKKEYENSPNTFGSSIGKKESQLELLIIVWFWDLIAPPPPYISLPYTTRLFSNNEFLIFNSSCSLV